MAESLPVLEASLGNSTPRGFLWKAERRRGGLFPKVCAHILQLEAQI